MVCKYCQNLAFSVQFVHVFACFMYKMPRKWPLRWAIWLFPYLFYPHFHWLVTTYFRYPQLIHNLLVVCPVFQAMCKQNAHTLSLCVGILYTSYSQWGICVFDMTSSSTGPGVSWFKTMAVMRSTMSRSDLEASAIRVASFRASTSILLIWSTSCSSMLCIVFIFPVFDLL